jgi:hypothetical protein
MTTPSSTDADAATDMAATTTTDTTITITPFNVND